MDAHAAKVGLTIVATNVADSQLIQIPRQPLASVHLEEASVSVLLNIAEGNGKRQRQVRAKFFDDARGSATECAACLDALVAKKICTIDAVQAGKTMLERVVSMLTKLVARFESDDSHPADDKT